MVREDAIGFENIFPENIMQKIPVFLQRKSYLGRNAK